MKYKLKFKALDAIRDEDTEIDRVRKFLESKGYTNVTAKTFGGHDYYFTKGKAPTYWIKVNWFENIPSDVSKTFVLRSGDRKFEYFTYFETDELMFFDGLGYTINSRHTEQTEESIDEWFSDLNRRGSEARWDIKNKIIRFYNKLIKDEIGVPVNFNPYSSSGDDRLRIQWKTNIAGLEVTTVVTAELNGMHVEKIYDRDWTPMSETELEFFRKLGFTLFDMYAKATGQKI